MGEATYSMTTLADPGKVFDSDAHRRVIALLPIPSNDAIPLDDLHLRADADVHTPVEGDDVSTVLADLESSGYVEQENDLWKMTQDGYDALNGPIANEPPPMEGAKLEEAEARNEELAKADAKLEKEAREKRVKEVQAQLAELKGSA